MRSDDLARESGDKRERDSAGADGARGGDEEVRRAGEWRRDCGGLGEAIWDAGGPDGGWFSQRDAAWLLEQAKAETDADARHA